eukprot:COSAG01_NODE_7812_length_3046_cov_6.254496_3_plen_66_part_00
MHTAHQTACAAAVDDYGFADVGYHVDMYGHDPSPQWNASDGANRMEVRAAGEGGAILGQLSLCPS